MTALIIVLSIVFLLLILCFLPITVDLAYDNEFFYRLKYAGIVLFNSEKRVNIKKIKRKKKKEKTNIEQTKKQENFFKKIYNKKGFLGTVKYFTELLKIVLKKIWWVLKRFKFRRFNLDLTVATDDAANTAIEYGAVCCEVYPVVSMLETNADFKAKQINISADFENSKSQFKIAISVTTRLFFLLVAITAAFIEYLKLERKESENNE